MKTLLKFVTLASILLAPGGAALAAERTVTLEVDNMTCASCPLIVRQALTAVPGVSRAEVSYRAGTAVVTFDDASREEDKLRDLYQRLEEARRETGQDSVPFGKFATIVGDEVRRLRGEGSVEVAVRVKVENGRVSVTARGLKGVREDLAEE